MFGKNKQMEGRVFWLQKLSQELWTGRSRIVHMTELVKACGTRILTVDIIIESSPVNIFWALQMFERKRLAKVNK